ncbi:MAG TPA: serine/threonine-protein kinase [Acidimicrobiia bacterium]|nr:serine/threonine-protein kinase [Acidimicrobiia bacterium]
MQLIADRYEPLEVIASGGMATVWRARDHRLDRLVALKRPHPTLAEETAGKRMEREARAAAGLSHPNLVTIYDYGSDENGPYLVMELLEGPTLQEVAGDIDAGGATRIGAQLADGLAAIHAAGIVHRDIKPANVVMSSHGPQLTDFGIATDPGLVGDITDPGQVVATPMYAAPEVLRGEEPGPRSDVYSLAVVIEELAGGSTAQMEPDLDHVLASAKAPTPEERPSAAELGDALRGVSSTVVRPVAVGGATLVLETSPTGQGGEDEPAGTGRGLSLWTIGLLTAVIAVGGLIALGLALASDDSNANASEPLPSVAATSTTTTSSTTTTTPAPVTTTTVATTEIDEIQRAGQRLEALLLEPPRSDLKRSDVESLMRKIDEAVEQAGEGKEEEAAKKLSEVAKKIQDATGGRSEREALQIISEIAELLGLDLDPEGDGGDD